MGSKKSKMRRLLSRVRGMYAALSEHRYTTIAGALVFFLVLSFVPFLFWLTLLFGNTGIGREEILELELFGWAKELLLLLRENAADAARGASVFFLGTTLWSSTGFFYHLRRSGEIVYGYRRNKHGLKVRLSALLLTFGVLGFFALSGGVLFAGIFASRFLPAFLSYPAVYTLLLVVGFFTAWILNAYVCPYRLGAAATVGGSALTAGLWLVASVAFNIYLRFSGSERLYGALTLLIVLLLFLYWMMICFTAGVIFNKVRAEKGKLEHKTL